MENPTKNEGHEDLVYLMALAMTPNIGPVIGRTLISHCGSAAAVFDHSLLDLSRAPGIGEIRAKFVDKSYIDRAVEEIEYSKQHDVRVLDFRNSDYPLRLKHFDNSPLILYVRGETSLNPQRMVGIIGTRTPTEAGRLIAEKITGDLSDLGVTVVSGLAHGVDGIAHRKCVERGMPTIGVMGSGMGTIYPAEHKDLYHKMIKGNGAVITEFVHSTGPDKLNFPLRNRIIAGLSDALIVVESKGKGGSIITAEFANEYNKDVFAVPGRIGDEFSEGCNGLIKKHKAYLLESVKDLCYIMRWEQSKEGSRAVQASLFADLTEGQQTVYDLIRQEKGSTMDTLCYRFSSTPSEMATMLLELEFKGVVRSLPGKKYVVI